MTTYVIFTREKTVDASQLEVYSPMAKASMEGHPVTRLAAYGRQQVLEGPETQGTVVLSFPTFEEAQAWYNSPAYKQACEHRFKGAEYRAIIVEGV